VTAKFKFCIRYLEIEITDGKLTRFRSDPPLPTALALVDPRQLPLLPMDAAEARQREHTPAGIPAGVPAAPPSKKRKPTKARKRNAVKR